MSKIIIVTFTDTVDNYGQVLQCYATQEYLKKRGHDVFIHMKKPMTFQIIRGLARRFKRLIIKEKKRDWRDSLNEEDKAKQIIFDQWNEETIRSERSHPRYFNKFKKKYFQIENTSVEKLHTRNFDVCVVGSDQTWSGLNSYFFLRWAPKDAKRISIAPSVGHKQFNDNDVETIRSWLKDFDLVTVREDNGVELCVKAGRPDVKKILDPTFLLSSDEYSRIELPHNVRKPFILLYLLGGEIAMDVSEIYKFAKKENLEVVYVASQGRKDGYPKYHAQVGQWLSLIKDAKYVFTNSFHGMAFSIIYKKQFMVFPIIGIMSSMNGRVMSLSKILNMDIVYGGDPITSVKNEIDYTEICSTISKNKEMLSTLLSQLNI